MDDIPKIIHYCWFGKAEKPELAKKCIQSWKTMLPGYEIREWNESNFDISMLLFTKQAYEAHRWAFVTDYVRLYALYSFGGIYFDTDIEVLKNLDSLVERGAFIGFQNKREIGPVLIAARKGDIWIKDLMDYYHNHAFILPNGKCDIKPNPEIVTKILKEKYCLKANGELQTIDGHVQIYPRDYFCPYDYETGKTAVTPNTYTIHHYCDSWHTPLEKVKKLIVRIMRRLLGYERCKLILDGVNGRSGDEEA